MGTITKAYYDEVVARERNLDADYAARRILLKLGKLRAPGPGEAILDVGCGTGVVTAAYSRLGLTATGLDVVPEFVEAARAAHSNTEYVLAKAEALPFSDQSFDFVSLTSVLEHVEDWRLTLREAARVLKKNGVLYLSTTNRIWPIQDEIRYFPGFGYLPAFIQRRIYSVAMKYRPQLVGYTHLPAYHWFTYGQLARELKRLDMQPHSWARLMTEADIPPRYRKRPILAILCFPIPLYSLLPIGTTIVARRRGAGAPARAAASTGE
jgi:ubiquinone/menaquinone biosynthesis C-methylase UbiE